MAKAAQIAAESAALQQIAVQGTQIERLAQTLKKWQHEKPELFVKRVYNQAGLDTLSGINR